jgi:hypothetical protein
MTPPRKRVRLGDILEVSTPRGLAYVQYAGKHPEYGHAIRVLPGFFQARPRDWSTLLSQQGYFTFYPVSAAVSQELITIAASHPIPPGSELPSTFRRRGAIAPDGKVMTWIIFDGERETLRTALSAEEKHLSIASIWNHAFLVERLVEEWTPDKGPRAAELAQDQSSRHEGKAPHQSSGHERRRRMTHYLYFPSAKEGGPAATELRKRGFEVESRPSGDEEHWLVLATHTVAGEEAERTRDELERFAEQHRGNYDGSEIAT